MLGTKRTIPCLLAACLLLGHTLAQAEQRYIVDTIVVSLRQGPGSQYKAVKTLQTGQSFEVLETQNGYSRVRTSDGSEGWVQEHFTTTRVPGEHALQINELNDKINALKAQNEELQKANALAEGGDGESAKRLRDKLAETSKRNEQLEQEAKELSPLREERDRLARQVTELQQATTDPLRDPQSILWFLSGGGVFLLGWMAGKFSGRRQRQSLLS